MIFSHILKGIWDHFFSTSDLPFKQANLFSSERMSNEKLQAPFIYLLSREERKDDQINTSKGGRGILFFIAFSLSFSFSLSKIIHGKKKTIFSLALLPTDEWTCVWTEIVFFSCCCSSGIFCYLLLWLSLFFPGAINFWVVFLGNWEYLSLKKKKEKDCVTFSRV